METSGGKPGSGRPKKQKEHVAMGVAEGGPPWGRSEAPPHTGHRPGILSTHVPLLQGGSGSGKKRADESERWASMCVNVCVSTNIFV